MLAVPTSVTLPDELSTLSTASDPPNAPMVAPPLPMVTVPLKVLVPLTLSIAPTPPTPAPWMVRFCDKLVSSASVAPVSTYTAPAPGSRSCRPWGWWRPR